MSENNLCECKFCIWVRNFVFIFAIKGLMRFVAFLLFSIIIQIVFESNNASALEQTTKNLPLKKPFLVVQNPEYKEVCNKVGNFLGVENVEQGDADLDFLTFSFDKKIIEIVPQTQYRYYRQPYGAFECCTGSFMRSYLLADVNNDGKKEIVDRTSGSAHWQDTTIDQSLVIRSLLSKDDADYDEVINYLFALLKRAMAFNNNLEEHGINDNLIYVESFFEREYRQVEALNLNPQAAEKIKKIIKQFQRYLEQKKLNRDYHKIYMFNVFFGSSQEIGPFKTKKIIIPNGPYIEKGKLAFSRYEERLEGLQIGIAEFFLEKEITYLLYNNFVIESDIQMKRYYEEHHLPANDMTYIKLSWQPEFYTPYNPKDAMYFKIAKGGEKDFKIVCLFELRESAPDKIFDIY